MIYILFEILTGLFLGLTAYLSLVSVWSLVYFEPKYIKDDREAIRSDWEKVIGKF